MKKTIGGVADRGNFRLPGQHHTFVKPSILPDTLFQKRESSEYYGTMIVDCTQGTDGTATIFEIQAGHLSGLNDTHLNAVVDFLKDSGRDILYSKDRLINRMYPLMDLLNHNLNLDVSPKISSRNYPYKHYEPSIDRFPLIVEAEEEQAPVKIQKRPWYACFAPDPNDVVESRDLSPESSTLGPDLSESDLSLSQSKLAPLVLTDATASAFEMAEMMKHLRDRQILIDGGNRSSLAVCQRLKTLQRLLMKKFTPELTPDFLLCKKGNKVANVGSALQVALGQTGRPLIFKETYASRGKGDGMMSVGKLETNTTCLNEDIEPGNMWTPLHEQCHLMEAFRPGLLKVTPEIFQLFQADASCKRKPELGKSYAVNFRFIFGLKNLAGDQPSIQVIGAKICLSESPWTDPSDTGDLNSQGIVHGDIMTATVDPNHKALKSIRSQIQPAALTLYEAAHHLDMKKMVDWALEQGSPVEQALAIDIVLAAPAALCEQFTCRMMDNPTHCRSEYFQENDLGLLKLELLDIELCRKIMEIKTNDPSIKAQQKELYQAFRTKYYAFKKMYNESFRITKDIAERGIVIGDKPVKPAPTSHIDTYDFNQSLNATDLKRRELEVQRCKHHLLALKAIFDPDNNLSVPIDKVLA